MSQSKDATPAGTARPSADRARERERRLDVLLEERWRLLGRLQELEQALAQLRSETVAAAAGPGGGGERVFAIRGGDVARADFEAPPEVDADDLRECLSKVVLAVKREGTRLDALELLVRFDPATRLVSAIASREAGDRAWTTQLQRRSPASASPPAERS